MQFLEQGGRWRRRASPPPRVRSADRYVERIEALERELDRIGIAYERRFYPGFWIGHILGIGAQSGYARGMVHLRFGSTESDEVLHVIEYSLEDDSFALSKVRVDDSLEGLDEYESIDSLPDAYELRALLYDSVIFEHESPRKVAEASRDAIEPAG